jgi:hypothetical protein
MELILSRIERHEYEKTTIGILEIENTLFRCWTCEDLERPSKIKSETAIPCGRYQVKITYSNRFKRDLPILLNVPNFEGIRIHPGNTNEHTEGCILLGIERKKAMILKSKITCNFFQSILDTTDEDIFITIKSMTNGGFKELASKP